MKRWWTEDKVNKRMPYLFERSMRRSMWSSLLEMPWSCPWHDRQRLRSCWVATCCGKWHVDMCRWFSHISSIIQLINLIKVPARKGKCRKNRLRSTGSTGRFGKLCRFSGNVHTVGGEQFVGSRGSRPLRFEAMNGRRKRILLPLHCPCYIVLVILATVSADASLGQFNATWQSHMFWTWQLSLPLCPLVTNHQSQMATSSAV